MDRSPQSRLQRVGCGARKHAYVIANPIPRPGWNNINMRMSFNGFVNKITGLGVLFYCSVAIPTALAIVYFGFLASDIYISQSQFVVRSPDKPQTTGFGFLLKSAGFSNSGDEIYAARNYITSRDAIRELNRDDGLAKGYSSDSIAMVDRFNPLGGDTSFEKLYRYISKKIDVQFDASTSITTLTTRAYNPEESQRINEALLSQAEALVNRLNSRASLDLIKITQREVDEAKAEAQSSSAALARYRNKFRIIDPERQATVQLQMVSKLQDLLIASRIELNQLRNIAPQSPAIEPLQQKIKSLQTSMDEELSKVAGDKSSLSSAAVEYERLQIENQFADKRVTAALAAFEEAKSEAQRKQAYIERISQPNLPDYPLEPRRFQGILATFIMGLIAWGVLSLLLSSVRDHVE